MVRLRLLVPLAVLLAFPAALAGSAEDHPDPGLSPSFALFPTHEEVVRSLAGYRDHPWVTLHELGRSSEGRPVWLAEVKDPESPVPEAERVVTFLFTQQHGNEPAGTPAGLAVLGEIAKGGPLAGTLRNQVLLLLPMANPDGATANQRANADGYDINRDHIGLKTSEARVLHQVLSNWTVHVAMDHHEYSGTGFGNPVPVRLYDYDLTTLYPNHGNVGGPTRAMAEKLMYEGIWPPAEAAGYTANEYGEQTVAGVPVSQVAGGPDPGIMRNHLGLHHVAGLLVETRVDAHPNPFHDAARRQSLHETVMRATLEYASEHAEEFRTARAASEREAVAAPTQEYLEGNRTGPLADAYRVTENLDELFARHAMPPGVAVEGGLVYDLLHGLRGHAGAALHPASTRAVADAVATEPLALPAAGPEPAGDAAEAPAPALLAVLSLVAVTAVASRSRRP